MLFWKGLEDNPFIEAPRNALGKESTSIIENLVATVVSMSGLMVGSGLLVAVGIGLQTRGQMTELNPQKGGLNVRMVARKVWLTDFGDSSKNMLFSEPV